MTPRALQPPLPWQCLSLCWVAGLLGASWPLPSLLFLVLLLVADTRLRPAAPWTRRRLCTGGARLLCCLLLWGAGCVVASCLLRPPPSPSWMPPSDSPDPPRFRAARLCGTVADARGLPDNRVRVLLREVRPEGNGAPLEGMTVWTWERPLFRPLRGQRLCLTRPPRPVHGFANEEARCAPLEDGGASPPSGADLRWRAQGVAWTLWSRGDAGNPSLEEAEAAAPVRWREACYRAFLRALRPAGASRGNQGAALLPALIFGEREHMSSLVFRQVAAASLAHSLALSGQHLAVAVLLGMLLARLAGRARPSRYLRRPRRAWGLLLAFPPALAYLWIGNAPPSLVRAACMLLAAALTLCFRWRNPPFLWAALAPRSGWDALCLTLLCMTLASPLCVYDTGLQLSVLCVGALCALSPLLSRIVPCLPGEAALPTGRRCVRAVARGALRVFTVSLILQLALLPLQVTLFAAPGCWFWLNVLWLPLLGFVVMPLAFFGLLCAVCQWHVLAAHALSLAAAPCGLLLDLLRTLADRGLLDAPAVLHPHWTALLAVPLLFLAAMSAVGRERLPAAMRRLAVAAALLLCFGPLERLWAHYGALIRQEIRLDVLDVGQGQAVLLTLPDGARWIIDGGGMSSPRFDTGLALVLPAVCANRRPALAAAVNTHPDLDHMGGLVSLLGAVPPATLLHNGGEGGGVAGERWRRAREPWESSGRARVLAAGDALALGPPSLGLRLEVLWPPEGAAPSSTNNASLILRLTRHGKGLALLPGDAEKPALRALLRRGVDLSAEVLLLPHHGSAGSFLSGFCGAVRPRLAVASCGFGNRYGYPAKAVRVWFSQRRIPLLDTGRWGRLRFLWRADAPARVLSARPGPAGRKNDVLGKNPVDSQAQSL